jgi:hypothetical protein
LSLPLRSITPSADSPAKRRSSSAAAVKSSQVSTLPEAKSETRS